MLCAPSKDSDQPSLISAQGVKRNLSFLHDDREDFDLNVCWMHLPFCWFCSISSKIFQGLYYKKCMQTSNLLSV